MKVNELHRPKTVDEALDLLAGTPNSKIIAGGTDLIIAVNERQIRPDVLIDVTGIDEMTRIWEDGDTLHIGAAASFSDIQYSDSVRKYCPSLCEAASQMGAVQIRNRATLGGNVANAATAADGIPSLLSMDACALVRGPGGSRRLSVDEVITGINQNSLDENELIIDFQIRAQPQAQKVFEKIGRRKALAISRINLAACVLLAGACVASAAIAVGAVGKTAYRVGEVEGFLLGRALSDAVIGEACDLMDEVVARNLAGRSTTPYKRKIAWAVLNRALTRVAEGEGK